MATHPLGYGSASSSPRSAPTPSRPSVLRRMASAVNKNRKTVAGVLAAGALGVAFGPGLYERATRPDTDDSSGAMERVYGRVDVLSPNRLWLEGETLNKDYCHSAEELIHDIRDYVQGRGNGAVFDAAKLDRINNLLAGRHPDAPATQAAGQQDAGLAVNFNENTTRHIRELVAGPVTMATINQNSRAVEQALNWANDGFASAALQRFNGATYDPRPTNGDWSRYFEAHVSDARLNHAEDVRHACNVMMSLYRSGNAEEARQVAQWLTHSVAWAAYQPTQPQDARDIMTFINNRRLLDGAPAQAVPQPAPAPTPAPNTDADGGIPPSGEALPGTTVSA